MKESINELGYPLVYKIASGAPSSDGLSPQVRIMKTAVRALEGMQKEAVVREEATGTAWRLVSDEGPYLNGTDLAPFPLAFFTTGMALSFTEAFLQQAEKRNIDITNYELTQDNRYTMDGSAIRGDMIGGALPVELAVAVETRAAPEEIEAIAAAAKQASAALALLNQPLTNTFALQHNGVTTAVVNVAPSAREPETAPHFKDISPLPDDAYAMNIIVKLKSADTLFGVEGGAGSSLQATQKRTLHVRGICTIRPDGLKVVDVQLFKPIGSTFRFLGDNSKKARAPSSLAYLSAGIGFCFMTQIGRYAHITQQELQTYSIIQKTAFPVSADNAELDPVETHVYLKTGETDEIAQKTVAMSERTCFLHAAMRQQTIANVSICINDQFIE